MKLKILIADDEPIIRMDLNEMLLGAGYDIVAQAKDGFEAIELCKIQHPDLAILDIKMPMLDGLKAAKIIKEERLAKAVIMLTAYSDIRMIEQAKKAEVMGYVTKPVDIKSLVPAIEIAISKADQFLKIESELQKTKQVLESRKLVDKAKGILMDKNKVTEEEAYSYMRKEAMKRGCVIAELAKIIILSNQ